jgi:hypothetical protein
MSPGLWGGRRVTGAFTRSLWVIKKDVSNCWILPKELPLHARISLLNSSLLYMLWQLFHKKLYEFTKSHIFKAHG